MNGLCSVVEIGINVKKISRVLLKALEQSCKFKHFAYYNFAVLVFCIFHRDVKKMKVSYKITQTDIST